MRRLLVLVLALSAPGLTGCFNGAPDPELPPIPTAVRTGLDEATSMSAAEQQRYLDVIVILRDRARADDCTDAYALTGSEARDTFRTQERFCVEVLPAAAMIDLSDASYVEVGEGERVRVTLGARRGTTSAFGYVFLGKEDGKRVIQALGLSLPS